MNQEIHSPTVRLIGFDGEQLGIVTISEALSKADAAGYDLAEIAPNAQPPVVRILDWGKFQYEQTKQLQKSRKNQKLVEIKQIRMGLKIGDHDLDTKLKRARKFLNDGSKVKVNVRFKGREITHPALGRELINRVIATLADIAEVEQAPQQQGRELSAVLGAKHDAKNEDA